MHTYVHAYIHKRPITRSRFRKNKKIAEHSSKTKQKTKTKNWRRMIAPRLLANKALIIQTWSIKRSPSPVYESMISHEDRVAFKHVQCPSWTYRDNCSSSHNNSLGRDE